MNDPLLSLGASDLRAIASGLRLGRLAAPYSSIAVQRFVSTAEADKVALSLSRLATAGSSATGIAETLEMLALAIDRRPALQELVDVVTTGPGVARKSNRDTSVVVGDLFRHAEHSIIVVGYAVHQGHKIFLDLADRMQACPELRVKMYLDIQRKTGDSSSPQELVRGFAHRFRTTEWPQHRPIPEMYYDTRSLLMAPGQRAALHAKCVVVDGRDLFISSANFTEAAQEKNIEVGLLVHSSVLAGKVVEFFDSLTHHGCLKPVL